ncbi:TRAP transporter permease [Crassaminicella profunda]|uniref:TRAP transporter permease n=1 Tax=Crassaminicella profunda TaxID=1286698 RepID=UPI001CA6E9E8|nr:TRAP transporter permease [Crassaminicella profunda]QZY57262.1 TRAP transporter permease [Crassaminicella profunda]
MEENRQFQLEEAGNAKDILRQYDKGSDYRELKGFGAKIISAILICFTLFQLYTGVFGVLDAMLQRAVHLAFGLCLVYLLYPSRKSWSREKMHPVDMALAIIAAAVCMYVVVFYKDLVLRAGTVTSLDMIVGLIAIVLVLEAARRVIGWPMVIIALLFIAYALFGRSIPGKLAHRGVDMENLVQQLFFTTEGVFGIPIGVSSTFIFMFLLFGSYLEKTGMGEFFIDAANAIAGFAAGGPAKVAVISSGCMGTLTGSSVANVVGTGSFTIPMMKKLGYKSEFAGAVEATASTGGQLMPPIMGAAAFLMAEFTNTPYVRVITAAAIPALLYYFGVFSGVHFEAKKLGLKGIPKEELPKIGGIMRERGHLLIPIVFVIYLLVAGYTPIRAALGAIASSIICAGLKKETRLSFKDILDGLEKGARSALTVVSACACAGIIIGVVTQTGLGLKMGSMLVSIANGKLLLTLFFTMITSLILGIGVPTTANYVITSTIAAPALLMMKVPILAAHMFAFYFGIIADVTPPVCLAAVAGAGVAKSEPMRTGVQAARLAIAAFLIPYIFVYSPQLLLIDVSIVQVIFIVITALIGIVSVAAALTGYFKANMSIMERLLFAIGGILLVTTDYRLNALGAIVIIGGYMIQRSKSKKEVIA